MNFENKVVLITGGSSGIGAATALLFAKNGAKVALSYKDNKSGAEKVIAQCSEGKIYQADLSIDSEAEKLLTNVLADCGRIDILVNNAGGYVDGDEWNGSSEIWMQSLTQNLVSMLSVSKYAIRQFEKQQSGIMVNVSSRYSKSGVPDALGYSVSKAGVVNTTQAYAKLLAPFGRANAVSPSAVHAGYWLKADQEELRAVLDKAPNHRLVEPDEVANLICYLASGESKQLNGENVFIDSAFDLEKFKQENS